MSTFFLILIILIIFGFIAVGSFYEIKKIDWRVHKTMSIDYAKTIKGKVVKGDFNAFHNEMMKRKWRRTIDFPFGFFSPLDVEKLQNELNNVSDVVEANNIITKYNNNIRNIVNNYIHSSVICFDKNCMQLDYESYKKYKTFIKYYKTEETTDDWKLNEYE